jgi:hypothetical protein
MSCARGKWVALKLRKLSPTTRHREQALSRLRRATEKVRRKKEETFALIFPLGISGS